ncbi:MAG: hypothetical protein NC121_20670 [Blautia sp.]|nr:hypothetical protein [Blautia sp.]
MKSIATITENSIELKSYSLAYNSETTSVSGFISALTVVSVFASPEWSTPIVIPADAAFSFAFEKNWNGFSHFMTSMTIFKNPFTAIARRYTASTTHPDMLRIKETLPSVPVLSMPMSASPAPSMQYWEKTKELPLPSPTCWNESEHNWL